MRVTVGMIVGQIGAGHMVDDVLRDFRASAGGSWASTTKRTPLLRRDDHAGLGGACGVGERR